MKYPIKSPTPKHIIITGASSGLGAALALAYAQSGVHFGLIGRHKERLQDIEQKCISIGSTVKTFCHDVTDYEPLATWLLAQDAIMPVDLVIANAGISAGTGHHKIDDWEKIDQIKKIFDVNLSGVIHTITPLLSSMVARQRGQIAIISSMAGLFGMPMAPAYSASKGAVRLYGDALRPLLRPHQIGLSIVCPGFIRTPMTDVNNFPMPMLMTADKAARYIQKKLQQNKDLIAFPWAFYTLLCLIAHLPLPWRDRLLHHLPRKKTL
jgi:short-subunit dehydrogenase